MITVAWITLCSVLALQAQKFERSRIESWSRIRTVIEKPGLWPSPDANLLCSSPELRGPLLLPTGLLVESLGRRVCNKGRLVDPGAVRPADSWDVERVRVLDGPHSGVEGWVLAYGLLETMRP
jgi:hypothetical protein